MIKNFLHSNSSSNDVEFGKLLSELHAARTALSHAYFRFNQSVEPDLVDACCYEINAQRARCNYFIRVIKECNRHPDPAITQKEAVKWA